MTKQMSSKIKIPEIELPTLTEEEYWVTIADGKKVAPLKKPCKDCAITTGFYLGFAQSLKKQPKEMQERVVDAWYCHNSCNRGCAGIREFLTTQPHNI